MHLESPSLPGASDNLSASHAGTIVAMEGTVLVIDDDPAVRKALQRILTGAGYEFEEASDAFQALEALDMHPPDAALLDIKMPGMDGIQATRRIVAELPGVKVLPLSIHSGKRFVENMLSAGAAMATAVLFPDRE